MSRGNELQETLVGDVAFLEGLVCSVVGHERMGTPRVGCHVVLFLHETACNLFESRVVFTMFGKLLKVLDRAFYYLSFRLIFEEEVLYFYLHILKHR